MLWVRHDGAVSTSSSAQLALALPLSTHWGVQVKHGVGVADIASHIVGAWKAAGLGASASGEQADAMAQ
jgi:hypothetical protein